MKAIEYILTMLGGPGSVGFVLAFSAALVLLGNHFAVIDLGSIAPWAPSATAIVFVVGCVLLALWLMFILKSWWHSGRSKSADNSFAKQNVKALGQPEIELLKWLMEADQRRFTYYDYDVGVRGLESKKIAIKFHPDADVMEIREIIWNDRANLVGNWKHIPAGIRPKALYSNEELRNRRHTGSVPLVKHIDN